MTTQPRPIRVAMYHGRGANPALLMEHLTGHGMAVVPIDAAGLLALTVDSVDVLYFPGGWYRFDDATNRAIRRFVEEGGGCVGTCNGAYLVAGYIPLIPGRVLRCNFRGRVYLEPQQGDHPILAGVVRACTRHQERKWEPIAMTNIGGPVILPEDRGTIVLSFDAEGELGALTAAQIGKGRAVAIASHPEMLMARLPVDDPMPEDLLYQGDVGLIVQNAVAWAAGR